MVFIVRTPLKLIVQSGLAGRFCVAAFGAVIERDIPFALAKKRSDDVKGTGVAAKSPAVTLSAVVGISEDLLATNSAELTWWAIFTRIFVLSETGTICVPGK